MNCTIEWEINGWMIAWLCILKEIWLVALIMRQSCNDFKIWKLVKGNRKLYVFACFFIVVVVVNIWISLFIRLYNLYFLRNTLRKIPGATTEMSQMFIIGMLMLMLMLIRMIILPRRHEIHGYCLMMTFLT